MERDWKRERGTRGVARLCVGESMWMQRGGGGGGGDRVR